MNLNLDRSEWKWVTFGDVVEQSKEKVDPTDGTVSRVIAGEHMDSNDLKIHRWGSVDGGYLGPAFHRRFRPGQVLYGSRRTYLRKVAVADFDGVCSNTTFVLSSKDENRLLPGFLPWVMTSEPFHAFAIAESKGSVNPYVNFSDIARYEFALPPLDQQQRIADLLWAVETHLEAQRNTNAVASQLERWLVIRTLDLPGTIFKLQEVGDVLMGRQRAPQYATGDNIVPYLRVANIGDNKLRLDDVKEMNFDPREAEQYRLQADDILVSEGQSRELVGQAARIEKITRTICFQNTLIRFRPDRSLIHPEFAFALVRALFYSGHFASLASQTTSIAHLGVKRFATCKVPVPTARVQMRRLEQIQVTQKAVAAVANVISQESSLRRSLLQEVFSS